MKRTQSRFLIVGIAAVLLTMPFSTAAQDAQKPSQEEARKEAELYTAWYEAQARKEYGLAKVYASRYLLRYPNGQYFRYLNKWMEVNKQATAEENVLEITGGRLPEKLYKNEPENPRVIELLDAVRSGKLKVLENLMQALIYDGDDVNIRIKDGKTILMLAAAHGEADAVETIIGKGADVNIKDSANGWTALIYAIWSDNSDVVQSLLNAGADVNNKDADGATVLDMAIIRGNSDIVKVIRKALGQN